MFSREITNNAILFSQILSYIEYKYNNYTVLHSSYKTSYSGDKTIIAFDVIENIETLSYLSSKLHPEEPCKLFGYFTYEAFNDSYINKTRFPKLKFQYYRNHITINHTTNNIKFELVNQDIFEAIIAYTQKNKASRRFATCERVSSNMTDEEFKQYVTDIRHDIENGEYYQLNLTRKYWGKFGQDIDKISVFLNLAKEFPSPYSALIRHHDKYIISSSPERFIKIEDDNITSRPIKGTLAKSTAAKSGNDLYLSQKDRAENLMIIDLMRNDLSLSAESGSVATGPLFEIDEFSNLYHMSTNVTATKKSQIANIDVIRNSFPPASMTGAPKLAVTKRISELEKLSRGIYSGAIGYFDGDSYCDFNVVIRTIIFDGNKFEYQVGGGITYDSDPELELSETKAKAAKIRKVLGLD